MTNKTKTMNIQARLDVRDFATIVKWFEEEKGLRVTTQSACIRDIISMVATVMAKSKFTSTENAISYLTKLGLLKRGSKRHLLVLGNIEKQINKEDVTGQLDGLTVEDLEFKEGE